MAGLFVQLSPWWPLAMLPVWKRLYWAQLGPIWECCLGTVMSWSLAGNRIAGTRYRETLWWEAQELSEHMRSVPILVTAIKTHQTTLQTLQIITMATMEKIWTLIEGLLKAQPLIRLPFLENLLWTWWKWDNPMVIMGGFSNVNITHTTQHPKNAVQLCWWCHTTHLSVMPWQYTTLWTVWDYSNVPVYVNPTTLISDSVCKQAYPTLYSTLPCYTCH